MTAQSLPFGPVCDKPPAALHVTRPADDFMQLLRRVFALN